MFELRPYQAEAIEKLREKFRAGFRRPVLVSATGSGKTTLSTHLIKSAIDRGRSVMFIVHRREILFQTHQKMVDAGIDNGWIMSGMRPSLMAPVHLASIQTLIRREMPPDIGLIIWDECHRSVAPTYRRIMEHYEKIPQIGLTATPCRADGNGLGGIFDSMVQAAKTSDLIHDGYLVPARIYAPSAPDLKGVKVRAGDYVESELEEKVDRPKLIGDIVGHWEKHAQGKKTIVFAVTRAHAQHLTEAFTHSGHNALYVDGETDHHERKRIFNEFAAGRNGVMVNVGIACLDSETEILTSEGWVGHDRITHEHRIANWQDGKIFFDHPLGIEKRQRRKDERMVTLQTRNISVRVTDDHRMLYRTWKAGSFLEARAHELVEKTCELPICGSADPFIMRVQDEEPPMAYQRRLTVNAYNLRRNNGLDYDESFVVAAERLERRTALRYTQPEELTDDDCLFIGFWLGDGSRQNLASGGVEYKVHNEAHLPNLCSWLEQLLEKIGVDYIKRHKEGHYQWCIGRGTGFGQQARRGLYRLEPYLIKAGTPLLWSLNGRQFRYLIRGFWMADGNHGDSSMPPMLHPRALAIDNTNRELFDLLQAIAVCRGLRCTLRSSFHNRKRNPNAKILYTISVGERSSHSMTKYRLQFEKEPHRDEIVWCVKSHSSFIVTRRRGSVVVTGNTEGYDNPAIECIVLARPTKSLGLYLQMAGRGMRPATNKKELLILDHSGASLKHGYPDEDIDWHLDPTMPAGTKPKKRESREAQPWVCGQCFYLNPVGVEYCESCHQRAMPAAHSPIIGDGDLVEAKRKAPKLSTQDREKEWKAFVHVASHRGLKIGAAYHMYKTKFGINPHHGFAYIPHGAVEWNMLASDFLELCRRRARG